MLKALKMIFGNVATEKATVPLPHSVPTPEMFRGEVLLDPAKCLGCGMCAYVCVSNAVTGKEQPNGAYLWSYEPGRCTFCARCADRCPGLALHMGSDPIEPYEHPGQRATSHVVEFHPCKECGAPVRFANEELLRRAFDHVKHETRDLLQLCERCRRRRLQRSMMPSVFFEDKETTK